jgi:tetrahydromethanopterin S-methyltransferase subunit G
MLMAVMMSPREKWTDERLDDLNEKVGHGFTKIDARFDRLEARMDAQFGQMNERFDRMQQTLIGSAVVLVAALLGILATQL